MSRCLSVRPFFISILYIQTFKIGKLDFYCDTLPTALQAADVWLMWWTSARRRGRRCPWPSGRGTTRRRRLRGGSCITSSAWSSVTPSWRTWLGDLPQYVTTHLPTGLCSDVIEAEGLEHQLYFFFFFKQGVLSVCRWILSTGWTTCGLVISKSDRGTRPTPSQTCSTQKYRSKSPVDFINNVAKLRRKDLRRQSWFVFCQWTWRLNETFADLQILSDERGELLHGLPHRLWRHIGVVPHPEGKQGGAPNGTLMIRGT